MPSGAPLLTVTKAPLLWPHSIGCFAGLGVRLVLVVGCRQQVNDLLEEQGVHAQHACGYRVTDAVAMQAVVQAAGSSRMEVEARLSKVRSGVLQVCRGRAGSHDVDGAGGRQHGGQSPPQQCGSEVQSKCSRLGLRRGPPAPSTCLARQLCRHNSWLRHRPGIPQAQLLWQVSGLLDEGVAVLRKPAVQLVWRHSSGTTPSSLVQLLQQVPILMSGGALPCRALQSRWCGATPAAQMPSTSARPCRP